nr:MAG TPA: hypothetical protein [Caudoviricetes sp.]
MILFLEQKNRVVAVVVVQEKEQKTSCIQWRIVAMI